MTKRLVTFNLFFIFTLILLPTVSHAAEVCSIDEQLNELISIKDDLELSEENKIVKEFEARKNLLSSIVSCSLSEIEDVEDRLKDIKNLNNREKEIRDTYDEALENFQEFYQDKEAILDTISDNSDKLKELAANMLSWREEEYNPKITNIVDFTFAFKQQKVINVASDRLNKITTSLEKILSIKDKRVTSLLDDSSEKIEKAKELRDKAHGLILNNFSLQFEPEKENTATTTEDIIIEEEKVIEEAIEEGDEENTEEEVIEEKPATPRDLIKESLQTIKDAYGNFFKLSKVVKTLLGF